MATRTSAPLLALSLFLPALAACSAPKPEPQIASSAAHGGYALGYPAQVEATTKAFREAQGEAHRLSGELRDYPGKLKDPDHKFVLEIVTRADEDGRGWAYVERSRRLEGANGFFETEKDEITRKVGGSAQFVAKKQGCEVDVYGAVTTSLKDTVDKQSEKELRAASEAHRLIERRRTALGKESAAALEKLADTVSRASYLSRVAVVEEKVRLRRLLLESDRVKRTLDEEVAAERAFQGEKKTTDADRKASEARIAELQKSRARLDGASQQGAVSLEPRLDEEVKKTQDEYDEALRGLRSRIEEKAR